MISSAAFGSITFSSRGNGQCHAETEDPLQQDGRYWRKHDLTKGVSRFTVQMAQRHPGSPLQKEDGMQGLIDPIQMYVVIVAGSMAVSSSNQCVRRARNFY